MQPVLVRYTWKQRTYIHVRVIQTHQIFFFFYVCVEANIVVHAIILPCFFFLRQLTHTKLECDFPIHNTKPTYPITKWDTRNKNQFLKKKGGVKKKRTWNQIKIMTHCKISFKCLNHSRFLLGTFYVLSEHLML